MEKIKKNFGFGCMRLPMQGEDVDIEQTKQMVDTFLAQGFNYFDTAHGYIPVSYTHLTLPTTVIV